MTRAFNLRQVLKILGSLLEIEAVFIALSSIVAFAYGEPSQWAMIVSAGITAFFGALGILTGRGSAKQIGLREGYLIVGVVWILFSIFGMLPFLFSGEIDNVTDAFFETMSGFTTTGATILTDVDHFPKGLLFWRGLLQWLGGMGIMVFSMAVLPMFGSGMQIFKAEVTGPTYDKIQPRIKDTARKLWEVYVVLTLAAFATLWSAGMDWLDAICHAFSAMSTGGFSTKQASVGYWSNPVIHYVLIVVMLVASINFALLYNAVIRQQFRRLWKDEELRVFLIIIAAATLYLFVGLIITGQKSTFNGVERNFRDALFQTVAIMTTTGLCTTDYMQWQPSLWLLLFMLTALGGCAGSTSGGIKIIRSHIAIKNVFFEFRRVLHPKAIMPVRINKRVVSESIVNSVHAFLLIFVVLTLLGTIALLAMGMKLEEAFGASLASISNVGVALGDLGPSGGYSGVPAAGKWLLAWLMLVGRLELFTMLVVFAPSFWRRG